MQVESKGICRVESTDYYSTNKTIFPKLFINRLQFSF